MNSKHYKLRLARAATTLLLLVTSATAWAQTSASYRAYNTSSHAFETLTANSCTAVTSGTTTMSNGWYLVNSNVTVSSRITVNGTVNLILADGATLTASLGITVHSGNTLNIYGQTSGTGALTATGVKLSGGGSESAAIGGVGNATIGSIIIHGGHITANGAEWSAGIGGGVNGGGGSVAIYGGTVNATGHDGTAEAIGCGSSGPNVSRILADGLRVTTNNNSTPVAYGNRVSSLDYQKIARVEPCTAHNISNNVCTYCGLTIPSFTTTMGAAGTETWYKVNSTAAVSSRIEVAGTVNLILCDGKTLTASQGLHVPSGVTLNIYGESGGTGALIATWSGNDKAGIGGDNNEGGGNITIYGGNVTASSGGYAASIGGGVNGSGGSFTIRGGSVTASSGYLGAGIGGGRYGNGGTITIAGGVVNATGGECGAGIGGGYNGSGGTITITGGTVMATAGEESEAIGHGTDGTDSGTLTLGDMKAYTSASATTPVPSADRESTCHSSYAKLTPCTVHSYSDGRCTYCGKNQWYILSATADNSAAIVAAGAGTAYDYVKLNDYTLYTDGTWNTIVLPFSLATLTGTPLAGATVKTLATSNYTTQDDGTLTMTFADATSIEAGKPYIVKYDADLVIRSTADWNTFASKVNNGTESYQGKTVMLAADITVSTMAGDGNRFKGTFDGCGHTLTFNKTASVANIAPFSLAENATFRNLRTAGTINTSGKFAAGLVAISTGACTIEYCRNSIVINSTVSGDGTHGGFIACCNTGGTVSFSNCLFDGTISGSNTTKCGGYVGWRNAPLTFTNCLMAGKMALNDNNSSCAIFSRNNASNTTLTNSYYKGSFGSAATQGTSTTATGSDLQALLGDGWEVSGGNVVPKMEGIVNPVFTGVTISSAVANVSTAYASFNGSYAPFASGPLFDARNTSRYAMHAAISIATPGKTGYTFAGWYTDAARQTAVTTIPFAADGNVTLYAKWTPVIYTITYNLAGGNVATDNLTTYNIESDAITLVNPTKDGYNFTGWTGTDLSEPVMTVTIAAGSTGNREYTATWAANQLTMANNDSNGDAIGLASGDGMYYDVTLADRTLYTDGDWNTLCLPFDVDDFTGTPLEGATVKTLESSDLADGTLTMTFSGNQTSIAAGKPYIVKWDADLVIRSTADWNTFASNVGNYAGKTVKLAADISVSSMVGGTFNGTLDGCGHTITVSLSSGSTEQIALFNTLGNATIKNLKIAGTITFGLRRPASIAAYIAGTTTIKNCWSSVNINSNSTSWVDGGAFVARVNSGATINMSDCLFTGSITFKPENFQGGGMVGWTQGSNSKANLTHCLFAPSSMTMTKKDDKDKTYVFVSGVARGNLSGCYYNSVANNVSSSVLKKEGTYTTATGSDLQALLGDGWEVSGGNVVPKMAGDIVNPVFIGVTISNTPAATETDGSEWVDFVGTYSPVGIYESGDDKHNLYLGSGNNIYYPTREGYTVKACRAYFQLKNGLTAGDPADPQQANVRAFVLDFGDGEETAIRSLTPDASPNGEGRSGWYTLDGRRLSGKPTASGIYINNGKKVVIK